jgi:2-keto-myo-inositol isomerase
MDFALNQRTAPKLGFAAFLDLAARLGCVGIEPRNDLGRPIFDGTEPARAGEMARERGLRLFGLSEVYPFNHWNEDRRGAVARLIETAQAAGAETVSLIPRVDRRESDSIERATALRAVLAEILPMLDGTGVVGLVEPIGFSTSSIRFQREATQAIESLGAEGRLGIVHDTFQHALAEDPDIILRHIRMVHISGLTGGSGILADVLDAQRVLVDENDRTDASGQVRTLLEAGYTGPFSYECTSSFIQDIDDPEAHCWARDQCSNSIPTHCRRYGWCGNCAESEARAPPLPCG